jgi:large subunit ribosomal protein L13
VKSFSIKQSEIQKNWLVIDAKNMVLGRLASEVAMILKGKTKPIYTPHMDCGDNVIIVNAGQVKLTGKKSDKKDGKIYYKHTGFPGGIKDTTAGKILEGKFGDRVIKMAVKRMLKGNALSHNLLKNLFVYTSSDHPHAAQQPTEHFIVKKKYNEK